MDLEFVVRISARHIPLSTYKKIRQVIAWQVENDLELPFYNPEFRRNLHGELDPAFTHRNFPSHTSEISNSRESKFFTDLTMALCREHDFRFDEVRVLDSILGIASIEFNKIIDQISDARSGFFVETETATIILDSSSALPNINGAQVFWGESDHG